MKGMWQRQKIVLHLLLASLFGISVAASGDQARVAVAANFKLSAAALGTLFTEETGHRVAFSYGSTGQLYAQIVHGAPFDIFLSADQVRAERAVSEGYGVAGSRFTYAYGRLALYSREPGLSLSSRSILDDGIRRIAVANPQTAPYGAAALQVIDRLGARDRVLPKLVRGTNVAQAFQFAFTGNADLALVAAAQVIDPNVTGSYWAVPETHHDPIAQDAVLLQRGADNAAALAFLRFLKGQTAQVTILRAGYGAAEGQSDD